MSSSLAQLGSLNFAAVRATSSAQTPALDKPIENIAAPAGSET